MRIAPAAEAAHSDAPHTYDHIPPDLRALPRWVVARGKEPYRAANVRRRASTTDPATWATFEAAHATALDHGLRLGFVFAEGDGLVGIDVDGCREPATGTIDPGVLDLLHVCGVRSYGEASLSGTGIHIIARGQLARGFKIAGEKIGLNCKAIECYPHGRFFVMTGEALT